MTQRHMAIRRAILAAVGNIPEGYLLRDDTLRADARRLVVPRPTMAELDEHIRGADESRQIIGVPTDEGTKWKLADAGRAWLAEHD